MASVASFIAQGDGFSSPYWVSTGPTALVPPVYPYLLAFIFKVFGVHTLTSGYVALFVGACISALTSIPIILIGKKVFGYPTGIIAGALWILYPLTGFSEFLYNWNTALFTLLFTTMFLIGLEMDNQKSFRAWFGFGLFIGFTVLTDTVSLSFIPFLFVWLYLYRNVSMQKISLAIVTVFLVITPWIIRNSIIFERPVFLRSNLGLELYRGVHEKEFETKKHHSILPNRNANELTKFKAMGEIAYMSDKLNKSLKFIVNNPFDYATRTIRRSIAFWSGGASVDTIFWFYGRFATLKHIIYMLPTLLGFCGLFLMIRSKRADGFLFLILLLMYPVVYYLTHTLPRFRFPIEPEMIVLSAFALTQLFQFKIQPLFKPDS